MLFEPLNVQRIYAFVMLTSRSYDLLNERQHYQYTKHIQAQFSPLVRSCIYNMLSKSIV